MWPGLSAGRRIPLYPPNPYIGYRRPSRPAKPDLTGNFVWGGLFVPWREAKGPWHKGLVDAPGVPWGCGRGARKGGAVKEGGGGPCPSRGGSLAWWLALGIWGMVVLSALDGGWGTAYGQTAPRPPTATATPTPSPAVLPPRATPVPGLMPALPAGVPTPIAELGGQVVVVAPSAVGAAVTIKTAPEAPAQATLVVPAPRPAEAPLVLRVQPLATEQLPGALPQGLVAVKALALHAFNAETGQRLAQLPQPLEMGVAYTDQDRALAGGQLSGLSLMRFDEATGQFIPLPAEVDPVARALRAQVAQTGVFALTAQVPDLAVPRGPFPAAPSAPRGPRLEATAVVVPTREPTAARAASPTIRPPRAGQAVPPPGRAEETPAVGAPIAPTPAGGGGMLWVLLLAAVALALGAYWAWRGRGGRA